MKAISLSRPWSYTILRLGKPLENRSRKDGRMPSICRHRGPLLLHAAKSWDKKAADWMLDHGLVDPDQDDALWSLLNNPNRHTAGAIVGRCRAIGHIDPADETVWVATADWQTTEQEEEAGRIAAELDMRWWMGGYALLLADVVAFEEPIPCRGMLGLWTPPDDVLRALEAAA